MLQHGVLPPAEEGNMHRTMPKSFPRSKRWTSAQRRVAKSRGAVLTTRVQVRKEEIRCLQQRQHSRDVQGKFMEVLHTAMEKGDPAGARPELDQLFKEIQESMDNLDHQEVQTRSLKDRLSDLEYRYGKREEELFRDLENALAGDDVSYDDTETSSENITQPSSYGTIQDDAPPLLQELYSRMGDHKVLRDRLNNFEIDLQEQFDARETLRGEGKPIDMSDEKFYEMHIPEHNKIKEELSQAQADVQRLRDLCLSNGIKLDELNDAESVLDIRTEPVTSPPDLDHPLQHLQSPHFPRSHSSVSPGDSLISKFLHTRDRINKWLTDIMSPKHGTGLDQRPNRDPWAMLVWKTWPYDETSDNPITYRQYSEHTRCTLRLVRSEPCLQASYFGIPEKKARSMT
ncbi:hypothetical protein K432DRAFT_400087 [Lepidopterella palustris CBS 459.81]|uniref:Uncharacterized protein n=1 Tax=Lepidopterella palustris CBS 459.81 TaxID=1314670 RepID=A0A8E2EKK7_9PEZI|nr:hypothetical protein K432DRAFT_400087 [Lepidopterella palustris CBS 459.81]